MPIPTPASTHDVSGLHRLRRELETWLRLRGIDQWRSHNPTEQDIADQVARGEWHVVRGADQDITAGLRLLRSDPEFWGDDPTPAVYVHGLMVSRTAAGTNLGTSLLEWACDRARSARAHAVRLDCGDTLRPYYRARGFHEVARREFDHCAVTLLEKPLTP